MAAHAEKLLEEKGLEVQLLKRRLGDSALRLQEAEQTRPAEADETSLIEMRAIVAQQEVQLSAANSQEQAHVRNFEAAVQEALIAAEFASSSHARELEKKDAKLQLALEKAESARAAGLAETEDLEDDAELRSDEVAALRQLSEGLTLDCKRLWRMGLLSASRTATQQAGDTRAAWSDMINGTNLQSKKEVESRLRAAADVEAQLTQSVAEMTDLSEDLRAAEAASSSEAASLKARLAFVQSEAAEREQSLQETAREATLAAEQHHAAQAAALKEKEVEIVRVEQQLAASRQHLAESNDKLGVPVGHDGLRSSEIDKLLIALRQKQDSATAIRAEVEASSFDAKRMWKMGMLSAALTSARGTERKPAAWSDEALAPLSVHAVSEKVKTATLERAAAVERKFAEEEAVNKALMVRLAEAEKANTAIAGSLAEKLGASNKALRACQRNLDAAAMEATLAAEAAHAEYSAALDKKHDEVQHARTAAKAAQLGGSTEMDHCQEVLAAREEEAAFLNRGLESAKYDAKRLWEIGAKTTDADTLTKSSGWSDAVSGTVVTTKGKKQIAGDTADASQKALADKSIEIMQLRAQLERVNVAPGAAGGDTGIESAQDATEMQELITRLQADAQLQRLAYEEQLKEKVLLSEQLAAENLALLNTKNDELGDSLARAASARDRGNAEEAHVAARDARAQRKVAMDLEHEAKLAKLDAAHDARTLLDTQLRQTHDLATPQQFQKLSADAPQDAGSYISDTMAEIQVVLAQMDPGSPLSLAEKQREVVENKAIVERLRDQHDSATMSGDSQSTAILARELAKAREKAEDALNELKVQTSAAAALHANERAAAKDAAAKLSSELTLAAAQKFASEQEAAESDRARLEAEHRAVSLAAALREAEANGSAEAPVLAAELKKNELASQFYEIKLQDAVLESNKQAEVIVAKRMAALAAKEAHIDALSDAHRQRMGRDVSMRAANDSTKAPELPTVTYMKPDPAMQSEIQDQKDEIIQLKHDLAAAKLDASRCAAAVTVSSFQRLDSGNVDSGTGPTFGSQFVQASPMTETIEGARAEQRAATISAARSEGLLAEKVGELDMAILQRDCALASDVHPTQSDDVGEVERLRAEVFEHECAMQRYAEKVKLAAGVELQARKYEVQKSEAKLDAAKVEFETAEAAGSDHVKELEEALKLQKEMSEDAELQLKTAQLIKNQLIDRVNAQVQAAMVAQSRRSSSVASAATTSPAALPPISTVWQDSVLNLTSPANVAAEAATAEAAEIKRQLAAKRIERAALQSKLAVAEKQDAAVPDQLVSDLARLRAETAAREAELQDALEKAQIAARNAIKERTIAVKEKDAAVQRAKYEREEARATGSSELVALDRKLMVEQQSAADAARNLEQTKLQNERVATQKKAQHRWKRGLDSVQAKRRNSLSMWALCSSSVIAQSRVQRDLTFKAAADAQKQAAAAAAELQRLSAELHDERMANGTADRNRIQEFELVRMNAHERAEQNREGTDAAILAAEQLVHVCAANVRHHRTQMNQVQEEAAAVRGLDDAREGELMKRLREKKSELTRLEDELSVVSFQAKQIRQLRDRTKTFGYTDDVKDAWQQAIGQQLSGNQAKKERAIAAAVAVDAALADKGDQILTLRAAVESSNTVDPESQGSSKPSVTVVDMQATLARAEAEHKQLRARMRESAREAKDAAAYVAAERAANLHQKQAKLAETKAQHLTAIEELNEGDDYLAEELQEQQKEVEVLAIDLKLAEADESRFRAAYASAGNSITRPGLNGSSFDPATNDRAVTKHLTAPMQAKPSPELQENWAFDALRAQSSQLRKLLAKLELNPDASEVSLLKGGFRI